MTESRIESEVKIHGDQRNSESSPERKTMDQGAISTEQDWEPIKDHSLSLESWQQHLSSAISELQQSSDCVCHPVSP